MSCVMYNIPEKVWFSPSRIGHKSSWNLKLDSRRCSSLKEFCDRSEEANGSSIETSSDEGGRYHVRKIFNLDWVDVRSTVHEM